MAVVLYRAGDWVCVSGGRVRPTVSLPQAASPPPRNLDLLPCDWPPGQSCDPLQREQPETHTLFNRLTHSHIFSFLFHLVVVKSSEDIQLWLQTSKLKMSRRPGDTKTDTDMILNFLLTFVNFHGPE